MFRAIGPGARQPVCARCKKNNATAVDGLVVGHRLMDAGEHELALQAYTRAAAEHGLTVDVISALGSANLGLGRLGQAEKLLRRAIKTDPPFPKTGTISALC